ncbi:uncharacterized protein ACR2FA_000866 [Aphomia sociella]
MIWVVFFESKHINILHQNINGLLAKSDVLSVHIEGLMSDGKQLDVICITEHNMKKSDLDLLKIPNYTLASSFTRNTRHGGSCILLRNNHKFKIINEIEKASIPNIIECSAVELIEHNTIVICIYRPPKVDQASHETFLSNLSTILDKYAYKKKKLVICGDFNIDRLKKDNNVSKKFEQFLLGYNLKLQIKEPTRLSSGTCLDNFIHNIRGVKCQVLELALSDHTAQIFECPVKAFSLITHWYTKRRDFSDENIIKFKEYISSLTFNDIYNLSNPNIAFNEFIDIFQLFYNMCFPVIKVKINISKKEKWITKGIRKCSLRKREMLWKYRKSPNACNRDEFKNYTKRLKTIINKTKKAQNDYFIETADNKTKATWNVINNSKNRLPKKHIQQIKINGKVIINPIEIARNFNNYFIGQMQPRSHNSYKKIKTSFKPSNSLFMPPTTPYEIAKHIRSLKNTNSTGFDDISTKIN